MTALAGVVVDDIENDFDPGLVQCGDHLLELTDLLTERADRAICGVRCEIAEGVVSPVVGEAAPDEERLGNVVVDRQQLNGCHAEVLQMLDDRRVSQPGVRAPEVFRNRRVQPRKALDVQLVDHRLRHAASADRLDAAAASRLPRR